MVTTPRHVVARRNILIGTRGKIEKKNKISNNIRKNTEKK